MKKVVAVVGMPGSGKSEVARVFEEHGFKKVRFGDITDQELSRLGLETNEDNECYVRQQFRRKYGMAAYAKLNLPRIDSYLESSDVVVDGLYSWEEYLLLKEHYAGRFSTVLVWSSPATRYGRLARRAARPLTPEEASGRDRSEIETSNKGGPIAMADSAILNEDSLRDMKRETEKVISALR
ncbi:MAG: AAA family ATPase [Dehalococcoidia bacterium]